MEITTTSGPNFRAIATERESLVALGVSETGTDALSDARHEFANRTAELADRIEVLRRDLNRATEALEAGSHVNSLGIVQGAGSSVDIVAALRERAADALRVAVHHVNRELSALGLDDEITF